MDSESSGEKGQNLAVRSLPTDFSLVLLRTIDSVRGDPAQLRNAIYELARIRLQSECTLSNPPKTVLETRRLMLALETAIERVETAASRGGELPTLDSLLHSTEVNQISYILPGDQISRDTYYKPISTSSGHSIPAFLTGNERQHTYIQVNQARAHSARFLLTSAAAVVALVLVLFVTGRYALSKFETQKSTSNETTLRANAEKAFSTQPSGVAITPSASLSGQTASSPEATAFPLPNVYGVYAISGGQLTELEALPGRVPDQRVLISATISKPSHATLPDGRVAFLIYRRDVATSAPDRVMVRVIAKIMRSLKYAPTGKSNTSSIDGAWAIRNVSYEFRVAPLNGNSEMLVVRPENPDFSLAAGRYGLVVKGQAYDFTIAGPITEAAHCLERIEAANGAFYSECKNP